MGALFGPGAFRAQESITIGICIWLPQGLWSFHRPVIEKNVPTFLLVHHSAGLKNGTLLSDRATSALSFLRRHLSLEHRIMCWALTTLHVCLSSGDGCVRRSLPSWAEWMYLASAHWAEELVAHLGSVLFLTGDVFKWLTAFRIADCEHCDSDGELLKMLHKRLYMSHRENIMNGIFLIFQLFILERNEIKWRANGDLGLSLLLCRHH